MLERGLERLWMVDAGGRHCGWVRRVRDVVDLAMGTCLYTVHASLFQCKEPLMSSPNLLSSRLIRKFPLSHSNGHVSFGFDLLTSVINPAPSPSSPSSTSTAHATPHRIRPARPALLPTPLHRVSPPITPRGRNLSDAPPASGSSPASHGARLLPPRSAGP